MDPNDPRHGEVRGASQHRRDGEPLCDPCRTAANRARKRHRYLNETGRTTLIDATGFVRRVRALQALGWSLRQIAAEAGIPFESLQNPLYRSPTCRKSTLRALTAAYDRLSMSKPPERTRAERHDASYARNLAKRQGWAPPLAWDDDIDDPNATPAGGYKPRHLNDTRTHHEYDEAVVLRILNGDFGVPASTAERIEVVRRWPHALAELERLTGWKTDRYTTGDAA